MSDNWIDISQTPTKDGRYIVCYRNDDYNITDNIEIAFREFRNGVWVNPSYNYDGDGWRMIRYRPE